MFFQSLRNSAMKSLSFLILSIFICCSAFSQESKNPAIEIRGKVIDPLNKETQYNLMVVNKTLLFGVFGDRDGSFQFNAGKNDSLLINAVGYKIIKLCFRDSIFKEIYHLKINLEPIKYELKGVSIFSRSDLNEIQEDIQKLGYNEKDYMLSMVDALQSPITFLYQMFSRRERSIRKVAELENEDKKRSLLKELFRKYVDADIIILSDEEFDEFIGYCNVSEQFMKTSTQYEFCIFIKKCFHAYRGR